MQLRLLSAISPLWVSRTPQPHAASIAPVAIATRAPTPTQAAVPPATGVSRQLQIAKRTFRTSAVNPSDYVSPIAQDIAYGLTATLTCPGVPDKVNPVADYHNNFLDYRPEERQRSLVGRPYELANLRLLSGPWWGIAHLAGQVGQEAVDSNEGLQVRRHNASHAVSVSSVASYDCAAHSSSGSTVSARRLGVAAMTAVAASGTAAIAASGTAAIAASGTAAIAASGTAAIAASGTAAIAAIGTAAIAAIGMAAVAARRHARVPPLRRHGGMMASRQHMEPCQWSLPCWHCAPGDTKHHMGTTVWQVPATSHGHNVWQVPATSHTVCTPPAAPRHQRPGAKAALGQ
jgi:hypothetical protein